MAPTAAIGPSRVESGATQPIRPGRAGQAFRAARRRADKPDVLPLYAIQSPRSLAPTPDASAKLQAGGGWDGARRSGALRGALHNAPTEGARPGPPSIDSGRNTPTPSPNHVTCPEQTRRVAQVVHGIADASTGRFRN